MFDEKPKGWLLALLLIAEAVFTIRLVMIVAAWPLRGIVLVVAIVLAVLALRRREVTGFVHRVWR